MKGYLTKNYQKALAFMIAAAIGFTGVVGVSVPVCARAAKAGAGVESAEVAEAGKAGELSGADGAVQAGESGEVDGADQANGAGEADNADQANGAGEADNAGQPGGTDEADNAGQPGGADEADNAGQPGGADEADDIGEPGEADKPDDTIEPTYTDKQGVIYTFSGKKSCYVSGFDKNIGSSIKIPETIKADGQTYQVKGINGSAFKNCTALKSVELPNSITDIGANVFKGCTKLKSIQIDPVKYTVKASGKTAVVTVKIDGGLLTTSADANLEIGADVVKEAASDKKTSAVTLQVTVRDNSSYQVKDALPDDIVLQQKAVKAIVSSGKSFKTRVKDAQGSSYYVKADAADLKQLSGGLSLFVRKKTLGDTTGAVKTDLTKALQKNNISESSASILSYAFEKDSKTNISIVFPVKGVKAGSDVYVYRYDKAKRVFAAVSFHPYTVSKQGTVTLPISKGGTFLATKKSLQYMSRNPASEFIQENGSTYYVDQNGNAVRGWRKISGEYYYFDRDNGKMATGGKVDDVTIQSNGTAKQTSASVAKIQTMIKARAIVEKVTNSSDSITVKREKCFRWVFQFPYRRYRRLQPIYKQPGWEVTFANDIFDHKQGCCVSEACAVAFLFHECGYKTVYVGIDTSHAWVELDGRVFDPLFAEGRGYSKYYNIPYSSYYMSKPVYKRKI